MQAAILEDINKFSVTKHTIPEPKEGQVLVKTISVPIIPSDILVINGAIPIPYPSTLGREGYGTVVKAGCKNSEKFLGKKVAYFSATACTWAEYTTVNTTDLIAFTGDLSPEEGATAFITPMTCLGLRDVVVKGGHKAVLITTASSCSKVLFRLFKEVGIKTIAVVRKEEHRQICLDNDASFAVNSSEKDFENNLKALAGEINATCCIECVIGTLLESIVGCMPRNSEIIIYGKLDENPNIVINWAKFVMSGVTLKSFYLANYFYPLNDSEKEEIVKKIENSIKDTFKSDVSKTYKFSDIREGYDYYLENMTKGRVIIKFD